jgi:TP901 family phage tail tape measure protein
MGAGMYTVRVIGELDSTRIRAELARISKTPLRVNGALGGIGVSAGKATKGVKGLNGQLIQTNKNIKKLNGKNLTSVASASEKSAKGMRSFGAETLGVTKKVIQFGAITAIIRGATSGLGDMVKNVYDLDGALTEFKKVSDLSGKGLEQYTDQAYKVGKTVARTGTEMIQAATEFKKSGFSEKDSLELGRVASMYQNVADVEISAGDAANFIVSQMKAFNMTAGDAEHIIDAVNEVSNNFAVSSADIATNIGKASAAMATGNVTYEQSVGLMTAMTEITRNGAKSARGLVSIQSRYNQIVDESSSTGKKLTAWYKEHNIAIKDQNGQLRSFFEVGADVAKIWDTLSDNEKRYYLNTQAGANQSQNLAALMRNYGTAIEATNTALDSAGSAAKENSRWTASMEGELRSLSSAWEDFSRKMLNSDMLKKGIKTLTKILEVLSSDVGQAIIKYGLLFASVATGLNLIVKAGMALKGLSLVKLFSGIGKGAKGATDGLKIMQGAQVGATKTLMPLFSGFDKLVGLLTGPVGLVAGIGLLSVALAKYVPIGEKARDIKLGKELKEAQDDVKKTEKRYKSLRDELDKLHEKEKEGTLTDSEQNRLNILENQTKQYERQVELKKQIATNKADEYYHTVDPSKLEGRAKDKYTLAKSAGKSDKEALAAAGINDKIALSLNNVRARADEVTKAQEKVTEAYEHHGKESKQYESALEDLDKAQKKQGDVLTELEKKRKKAIEDYGSVKKANKALGDSWKELNKEIGSLKALKSLNFKKPSKDIANLKKNAKNLGLEFDKSGKKINKIDLKSFSQKMSEAGYSVEDTWKYIKQLSKENPNIKVKIDGTDTAAQDLEFVDGKIQKIKEEKPKAVVTISAKDYASGKMKKIKADKNLGKARKTLEENGGNKVQSTMGKLKKQKNLGKATKRLTQTGGDKVSSKMSSLSGKTSLGTATKTIHFSLSGAVAAAKKFFGFKKGVRHFASGGNSSIFDNAEVNEQGFEIIQDAKTGFMRVANGGKRGTTRLNRGDTVYTHGQSVRMLQRAGSSEGKLIYGHNRDDVGLFGIGKLPGFKKGKNKKKEKLKKAQKKYNKQYNAIISAYDKALSTLEYKRDTQHWSEKTFITKYNALQKKYNKKIKALNKKKTVSGVKKKKSLGTDRLRAYGSAKSDYKHTQATENISEWIEGHVFTDSNLSYALKKIQNAKNAKKISAEEAAQYRKEAYKKNLEYNLKLFENDKKTFKASLALLKKYYDKKKITSEEYYQYLEELAKNQLEKEKKRLTEQQTLTTNTYDLARSYVQRQIDLLEEENDEQKEQNELVELQNNLAKARNTRIRIYKEGEGFVYEQDTQAIKEATESLKEYQKTAENPVLNKWKEVLKLFDEYETNFALRNLENQVGATVGQLFGALGTDTSAWAAWIKNNLSTSYGLQNVLDNMDKLVDTNDILNYLNGNGQVPNAIVQNAIANNALPSTYAAAITQAALASGSVVGSGVGISQQSAIASATSGTSVSGALSQYGNVYNFENLVLPNVTNPTEFINELKSLSTTALQSATQRV